MADPNKEWHHDGSKLGKGPWLNAGDSSERPAPAYAETPNHQKGRGAWQQQQQHIKTTHTSMTSKERQGLTETSTKGNTVISPIGAFNVVKCRQARLLSQAGSCYMITKVPHAGHNWCTHQTKPTLPSTPTHTPRGIQGWLISPVMPNHRHGLSVSET